MKTILSYIRRLAGHIWHLVEPVLEHGCLSIVFAGLIRAVSVVLGWFLPDLEWREIHEIEALGESLVALLFVMHTLGVLAIRIAQGFVIEVRSNSHRNERSAGSAHSAHDAGAESTPSPAEVPLLTEGAPRFTSVPRQADKVRLEGEDDVQ